MGNNMNYVHKIGKWTKIFASTHSILHRILLESLWKCNSKIRSMLMAGKIVDMVGMWEVTSGGH